MDFIPLAMIFPDIYILRRSKDTFLYVTIPFFIINTILYVQSHKKVWS